MSNSDYKSYRGSFERGAAYLSVDEKERLRAEKNRTLRLREEVARSSAEAPRTHAKPAEVSREKIEHDLACNVIDLPPKDAQEVHLALVDNSGSNAEIARGMRDKAGYMNALFETVATNGAFATVFFSDHCDGGHIFQDVGYVMPGAKSDKILRASIAKIAGADGGDQPEAIECALKRAAELDFSHVPKERRHLYLVSDQVAHGMGLSHDDGCPRQVRWDRSLELVHDAFGTFQVIASGDDARVFNLQKQFIASERRRYDLMDFATGGLTANERCRLVTNGLVFLVARNRGVQTVTAFLMLLLEKWMAEPMYGSNTLKRARQQIGDFTKYLEMDEPERTKLMDRIFAGLDQEQA